MGSAPCRRIARGTSFTDRFGELGTQLIERYDAIEARLNVYTQAELKALPRLAG